MGDSKSSKECIEKSDIPKVIGVQTGDMEKFIDQMS